MCLAIVCPVGRSVSRAHLAQAFENNPDGAGYAFVSRGKVHIRHFLEFEPFLAEYAADVQKYGKKSPFLIHFRYATHGDICEDMCHPFRTHTGAAMIHNGILPSLPGSQASRAANSGLSDTALFVRDILPRFPLNWKDDDVWIHIAEEYVGCSNKLAFLWPNASFTIINEMAGYWNGGVWYSNKSHINALYWAKDTKTGAWSRSRANFADDNEWCEEHATYYCETCEPEDDRESVYPTWYDDVEAEIRAIVAADVAGISDDEIARLVAGVRAENAGK